MTLFKVLWQPLKLYYEELFPLLLMSGVTVFSWVLIIPGPFALAGLWHVAQRVVRGRGISWHDYWQGAKLYGGKTWLTVLLEVGGIGLLLLNVWFYNADVSPVTSATLLLLIDSFLLLLGMALLGTFFYLEAFLLEQEETSIKMALRNSFYLTLLHPINTLIWAAVSWLILILSVIVPIFLFVTPGYLVLLSLVAMRTLVKPLIAAHEAQQAGESVAEEDE